MKNWAWGIRTCNNANRISPTSFLGLGMINCSRTTTTSFLLTLEWNRWGTNNYSYPDNVLNCSRTKPPFVRGGSLVTHGQASPGHGVLQTKNLLGTSNCSFTSNWARGMENALNLTHWLTSVTRCVPPRSFFPYGYVACVEGSYKQLRYAVKGPYPIG